MISIYSLINIFLSQGKDYAFLRKSVRHILDINPYKWNNNNKCKKMLVISCNNSAIRKNPPFIIELNQTDYQFKLFRPGLGVWKMCGPIHLIEKSSRLYNNKNRKKPKKRTLIECALKCYHSKKCVAFIFIPLINENLCSFTDKQCPDIPRYVYLAPGQNIYLKISRLCYPINYDRTESNMNFFFNSDTSMCYSIIPGVKVISIFLLIINYLYLCLCSGKQQLRSVKILAWTYLG